MTDFFMLSYIASLPIVSCNTEQKLPISQKIISLYLRILHLYFHLFTDSDYVDQRKVDIPRGFPKTRPDVPPPNKVSEAVFEARQHDDVKKQKLSTLFMSFGQFLDHDLAITLHGECNVRS